MKRNFLGIFILPIFMFSFISFFNFEEKNQINENIINTTNIESSNSDLIKSDNPNNHYMVNYDSSDNVTFGGDMHISVIEKEDGQYIQMDYSTINFNLNDPYEVSDLSALELDTYLTLYDVTNGNYEVVEVFTLKYNDDYSFGYFSGHRNAISLSFAYGLELYVENGLQEFHEYRMGYNIKLGDDMRSFSNNVSLATPELSFTTTSTENSISIAYEFINPSSTILFEYNSIYLEVDKEKYDLGTNPSGEITVDELKPAKQYSVVVGYDATKIISSTKQYDINYEYQVQISTLMPPSFSVGAIATSLILLIILIVILLILLIIIIYWNHQRRKISGLALIIGEDAKAQDPIYNQDHSSVSEDDIHNNENFDESAISSNDGYDGHYYNEDEYNDEYEIDNIEELK